MAHEISDDDKDDEEFDDDESDADDEGFEDDDEEVEEDSDDEEQDDDPEPLVGEELNAELFRSAVENLQEAVPSWKQQADLLLGHSVNFIPDFNSLEGRFDRIQPFVHFAVAGTLEALAKVRFDPAVGSALAVIHSIVIQAHPSDQKSCNAELFGPALTVRVPLDGPRPPTEAIAEAIRGAP